MQQKYDPHVEWTDEPIRPKHADTTIGWAGKPLSQTLAYYGHIPRATLPTSSELGFDPDYASVDVQKTVQAFAALFSSALESQNVEALVSLIHPKGYWKDVELLTWDIRALQGHDAIRSLLTDRLQPTGITNVRLSPRISPTLETIGPDLAFLLLHLEFDFAHGTGVAVARLTPSASTTGSREQLADVRSWRIYSIGTSIHSVRGWDAESGDKVRYGQGKYHDPHGLDRTYPELRQAEINCENGFEPTVVIIGAGQNGVFMAARCRALGIPHLVIEKEDRAGYSWASRYATLSLHGPTFTNQFPYVSYPSWFPTFLPAKQLADWIQSYASIMNLNIWTNSVADGHGAIYDDASRTWTLQVTRADGSCRVLHPRHLIITTGLSGTLPNIPQVPGIDRFVEHGGKVVHSSRHRTTPDWKGKKCIVVGAATSAHDMAYELTEHGCEVTMIQRSATHVMTVEKSVLATMKAKEKFGKPGEIPLDLADQTQYLKQTYPIEYELLPRGQRVTREIDRDLIEALRDVGYRTHDGYHDGGAYSMFPFDQGGFYYDNGACKLITDRVIKLVHSEIDYFTETGVVYKDGSAQAADAVVFATGYMNTKGAIDAFMGEKMAKKCNERWEKGNAFFLGPEGESVVNCCPLPQKGLYAMFHQFAFARFHSARLALRIKAEELGIDVTPWPGKPLGPPSTAAGQRPQPAQ
ncbi:hypothetical protein BST61_g9613 [Cercospora zeina]